MIILFFKQNRYRERKRKRGANHCLAKARATYERRRSFRYFCAYCNFCVFCCDLIVPIIIGHIVDVYLQSKNFHGVVMFSIILAVVYIVGLIASYIQVKTMGGVGRRLLFNLRNKIFEKLEELTFGIF